MSHPLDRDALFHCECGEWHYKDEIFSLPCKRKEPKMAGAARKTKLSKYEVIIKRQIEHVARIEVEARNAEEAQEIGEREADEPNSRHWREGDVISQDTKVKVSHG